ncbi:MAG: cyclic nucleotide-binding domain-containing protein [Cyanobacteria bacterium RI_101]|nr:cyclic nucleotide-binding domain-containing protein [Cyanobacteria bacterium RI_101]
MLSRVPEPILHRVRWILTSLWLLLIASLFYDPFSPWLTAPEQTWSPFRIRPDECIAVQNRCLELDAYPLGAPVFWGLIVPSAIFILLVFGHEFWRRICPLSFLSQIPRALGRQRKIPRPDAKSGKVRYEILRIKAQSWLGRHYLYLQFGLLFLGLCCRILFINGDRLALALWLLATIFGAVAVGYLYGGKSWCNYFCPMAPVQKIYAEPGGLLTSRAHMSENPITQSMCRTVEGGKEKSACVACQTPCIDIDAEGSYWEGVEKPQTRFVYYCYFGLVVGYFFYYYLYAGNWNYYFSGAWAMEGNSLKTLLAPGWYLYGQAIPVPKLVAVPLTLALFTLWGYGLGVAAERLYRAYLSWKKQKARLSLIRHHLFSVGTFLIFNFFFQFGGRPFIRLLPEFFQESLDVLLVLLSSLWLAQALKREPELYAREGLAGRFRKQLIKMKFPIERYFAGRAIDELNPHEIYVVAKVLPGFTQEKRQEAYKGVLREALAEGYVNSASSLEVLQQMREELDIDEGEHKRLLGELGVEDPALLDPARQNALENLVRISGYRHSLERLMTAQKSAAHSLEGEVWETETAPTDPQILKEEGFTYLYDLEKLIFTYHSLNQPLLRDERAVINLLLGELRQKKERLVKAILFRLEKLAPEDALPLATALGRLSPTVLPEILERSPANWPSRLDPTLLAALQTPYEETACSLELPLTDALEAFNSLLAEPNPLIQSLCLFLLAQFDPERRPQWQETADLDSHPLLAEVKRRLNQPSAPLTLDHLPTLEKIVCLYNSDFFQSLDGDTLLALAQRAEVKTFDQDEHITEAGDTCRELLILLDGAVEIQRRRRDGSLQISSLLPGKILDELEVLAHAQALGTILAKASPTRVLALPVAAFDDLLERNRPLALKVLELESLRLKNLLEAG